MSENTKNTDIKHADNRHGTALLMVLFIVATVSILSLGFAIKADTELSCGKNVELRMDMDYLGLTSLNYAKSLVVNPQDVTTGADGYWQGGTGLQIEEGDDYFDISVVRSVTGDTPECTYDISSMAYRLEDGVKVSETKLQAQLRLDPFIAYWAGGSSVMHSNMKVYGDVYCYGTFTNYGEIYGDVFTLLYSGSQTGLVNNLSSPGTDFNVTWPGIVAWRFDSDYYIDNVSYDPAILYSGTYTNVDWGPTASNPAGIYYHNGNLVLYGDVKITGTLIVTNGYLKFGDGNVAISSLKNYPAIVCEGSVRFSNASTDIKGLVQANAVNVYKEAGDITINGGLFIRYAGIEQEFGYAGNIIVRGDPMKASVKMMSSSISMIEWSPVGGAYYKSIKRDNSN